jgi:hypothetical protein
LKYEGGLLLIILSITILVSGRIDAVLQEPSRQSVVLQETPEARLAPWMATSTYYENRTHRGDLIIENGTYLIEDMEFHLFGKMSVRHDATVVARDAKFVLSPEGGVSYREAIVLENESRFIAENLTVVFQPLSYDFSYIVVDDEAQLNITDSQLSGWGYINARHNATVHIENGTIESLKPEFESSGVITEDNAFARIQNSKLDYAGARDESSIFILKSIVQPDGVSASGKGTIEIENSDVGYCEELPDSSILRITNSTIEGMNLVGGVLHVQDSQIKHTVWTARNCTVWFIRTSVASVYAGGNSTIWLINSAAKQIQTSDQAQVNVGWQLPVLGTLTVPHRWIPILQAALFIVTVAGIIAALVLINKRWNRWQTEKMKREATSVDGV